MNSTLQSKLELAHSAFESWRSVAYDDRKSLFAKLSQLLKDRAENYGKIITTEMHKPITQSKAEVNK